MFWAIEHATESDLGQPWSGHERDLANRAVASEAVAPPERGSRVPLRYVTQTDVPDHWIPFIAVAVDPALRDIALERSAMLRPAPDGTLNPIEPLGRILRPTQIGDGAYRIPEEEVPRSGGPHLARRQPEVGGPMVPPISGSRAAKPQVPAKGQVACASIWQSRSETRRRTDHASESVPTPSSSARGRPVGALDRCA